MFSRRRRYLTIRQIAARIGNPNFYHRIRRKVIAAFEFDSARAKAGLDRIFGDSIINVATGRNYALLVDEVRYLEIITWKGGRP